MLASMSLIEPQLSLHGLFPGRSGWIGAFEDEFVQGYFGDKSIPWPALRLYQIQALLAAWVGAVHEIKTESKRGWSSYRLRKSVKAMQCRRQVRLVLDELIS